MTIYHTPRSTANQLTADLTAAGLMATNDREEEDGMLRYTCVRRPYMHRDVNPPHFAVVAIGPLSSCSKEKT